MADINNFDDHDDREKVCSVCRRSESRAGRMLRMPGGTFICTDCLQKMLDSFEQSGFDPGSLGFGPFTGMPFGGMPQTVDKAHPEHAAPRCAFLI